VEEQQNKAMEEDPSVFAYDEVYDEMKEKTARPKMQDKVVREVIPLFYARDCLVAV
jgi:coiled-coil domain-containing protein 55